jgi:hypothetical protein
LSHYNGVLEELRNKKEKLASECITELYLILKEEEHRSPEECRAKIESDCSEIWSEDTIRKYLPLEAKNTTKRKAGKISAEIKKKKAKEAKPLVVHSGDSSSSSDQISALIDSRSSSSGSSNDSDNSVGMNPTENGSVGQKKQESSTFQEIGDRDSQHSGNLWAEDYFSSLIADRLNDEASEEEEDLLMDGERVNKSLLLPSELAEQIYSDVNASWTSKIIPEFELEHNGIRIVSVRMSMRKLQESHEKADSLSWRSEK